MGKKFFIQEYLHTSKIYHGGIGCKDVERILLTNNYIPIKFPLHNHFTIKTKIYRLLYFWKILFTIPSNSTVIFTFETYVFLHKYLIKMLCFRSSITIICIMIDIDGIKDGCPKLLQNEIRFLKKIRHFVVHNNTMKKWLITMVPGAQISVIEFFDFLTQPIKTNRVISNHIDFAGNLTKSNFIKKLFKLYPDFLLTFSLYGTGVTEEILKQPNVKYKGVFDPYILPGMLNGSFGLVWDGDSIESSNGILGEYIKIISPHKLSSYIVAGLPVIASTYSATAELINKYKIGFTVDSLLSIQEKIRTISLIEYKNMQENCFFLAQRITKGTCLVDALNEHYNP